MRLWTLRVGIVLSVAGLLLLTPLADLLPFDFWSRLKSLFRSGSAPFEHVFYRLVPGEPSRIIEFALIGIGLALVCVSLYVRHRK